MDDEDGQDGQDTEPPVEWSESRRYARSNVVLGRGAFKTGATCAVSWPEPRALGGTCAASSLSLLAVSLSCAEPSHAGRSCSPQSQHSSTCVRRPLGACGRLSPDAALTTFAWPFARSVQGF